jgi:hypothetical protein
VSAAELREALRCGSPRCECARGHRRTHCPASGHPDRRPSFDVDERDDKTLMICRSGCRQEEILAGLRQRGLWSSSRPSRRSSTESPLAQARREILLDARRQQARLAHYAELFAESDSIRGADRVILEARAVATRLGPREDVFAWLWQVAELELDTRMAEARLDDDLLAKAIP